MLPVIHNISILKNFAEEATVVDCVYKTLKHHWLDCFIISCSTIGNDFTNLKSNRSERTLSMAIEVSHLNFFHYH